MVKKQRIKDLCQILAHRLFFFRPSGLLLFFGVSQGSALRLSPWVLTFCPAGQLVADTPLLGASNVLSVPDKKGLSPFDVKFVFWCGVRGWRFLG